MSLSNRETKNLISYLCLENKNEYCLDSDKLKEFFNNPQKLIEYFINLGLKIDEIINLFHSGLEMAVMLRKNSENSSNIYSRIKKLEYSFGPNTIIFYYFDCNNHAEGSYPVDKIRKFTRISPNKLEIFAMINEELCYADCMDKKTKCKYFHYFYLPKPIAEKFSIVLNKMPGFSIDYLRYHPIKCLKNRNCIYTLKSSSETRIDENFFKEFVKRYFINL